MDAQRNNSGSEGDKPDPSDSTLINAARDAVGDAVSPASGVADGVKSKHDAPPDTIGPYKILSRLGQGGMGVVYLAEQTKPIRRRVALKLIKPGMDSKAVIARFESERQALAMMDHPGVAKMFDAGASEQGRPYFVMEYVHGIPITDYCDKHRLPTKERLALFMQVCQAIQHAHQKGIIHRDIKPSNVLVTVKQDTLVPKVIDFGIAKATQQKLTEKTLFTEMGQLVGTPAYMSPEQADSTALDIDTRSDIYSLGVMLYELLAGALPFEPSALRQAAFGEIQRIIREQEPPKPSTRLSSMGDESGTVAQKRQTSRAGLQKQLRGDLDWITMKALEKDRKRRYATATEFAADIARHLTNEPVLASPPSAGYRLRKFVRRNKGPVTAVACVIFAILAGSVVSFRLYIKAERARAATMVERDRAERETETAKQVQKFMIDIFKVSDPSEAKGSTITAREIMDKGAERIAKELTGQPLIQATLMQTISDVYEALGLYSQALPIARQSLELYKNKLGKEDTRVATSLDNLADILLDEGQYAAAEKLNREALAIRRKLLGDENLEVAESFQNLALVLDEQGRHAEAEKLYRQTLAMCRKLLGDEHPDVGRSLHNLAVSLDRQGKYAEAEMLYRRALAMQRKLFDGEYPDVADTLSDLALVLDHRRKYVEAEKLYRQALEMDRKLLGDKHPRMAKSINNLGIVLEHQGEFVEAEQLYRQALEMNRKLLGDEHPSVARSLRNVLNVLKAQGTLAQRRPLTIELLAYRRKIAEKPNSSLSALNEYAWDLLTVEPLDLRAPSAALRLARKAVEKSNGTNPFVLDTLALAQQMTGNIDAAVETETKAVALLVAGPSALRTSLESSLAKYLIEQKSHANAEPFLLSAYNQLKDNPKSSPNQRKESIERIIRLYESWHAAEPGQGHDAKAAEWRAKLAKPPADTRGEQPSKTE